MQEILQHVLGVEDDSDVSIPAVLDKIAKHFRDETNIIVDRLAFDERVQEEGERFSRFVAALYHLHAVMDGCAACKEVRIHTRIVAGIRSSESKANILKRKPTPSLEELIEMMKAEEAAMSDVSKIERPIGTKSHSVANVSGYKKNQNKACLLYTSPSPRDRQKSRMPSSA